MSASSSRARQDADAEPEAAQRRWVALASKPIILADAEDRRARAMARRTAVELDLRDPPRRSYLVPLHPRIVALDLGYFAVDRSGRLHFRVTNPGEDCSTRARRPYSELGVEAQPPRSVGLIADGDPRRRGHGDRLLCYYSTETSQWFLIKPLLDTSAVRARNLCGETGVLAHDGRLALACDPFAEPSRLRFVPLPDDCEVWEEEEELSQIHGAHVAPSEGLLRYLEIRGLSPDVATLPVNPSVRMWTLVDPEAAEPARRIEYEVHFADVWMDKSYAAARLPHGEVPHVALVDPELFGLDVRERRVVSCEDCSVRDGREIKLQNSGPIIDAWEQSSPTPSSAEELIVLSTAASDASYTGLDNSTVAHDDDAVVGAPVELSSASAAAPGDSSSAGKAHDDPVGRQEGEGEGDDAMARNRRSHVPAETELRRPHFNANAGSVLQGPRRIADLATGRKKNPACHGGVPSWGPRIEAVSGTCHGVRGFKSSARLERRRHGKARLTDGETSSPREISNTVTICLDGKDGKEVLPSYCAGITALLEWCHENGMVEDVSDLFGSIVAEVFTTPPDGTFYLILKYKNRMLELVISGRDLYMMGWRGPNGAYEIKSDSQEENYMDGDDVIIVAANKNYQNICPNRDVGRTKMGIHEFRKAFDDLYNYRGQGPKGVEEAIGKIAVYISEAVRLQGAYDTVCESLKSEEVSRLNKGKFNPLWINRYGRYSTQAMQQIDRRKRRKEVPPITNFGIEVHSVEDILKEIRVLHFDAYNEGIFEKKKPRPKVFKEQRSKRTGQDNKNKRWPTAGKNRHANHPARPPRRGYTTCSSDDSAFPPLPPLKGESSVVESCKHLGGLDMLRKQGDEVIEYMHHFPALRRMCNQNYERHVSNRIQDNQCLPKLAQKSNRQLERLSPIPTPPRHPAPTPTKGALVRPEVPAAPAKNSKTISLGTPKTMERAFTQKAPIRVATNLVSKLLRFVRR